MTMRRYLDVHEINYMFQSAYRPNHNTPTTLVTIFNDISLSLGTGKKVLLWLLDMSAAFDTLKHSGHAKCHTIVHVTPTYDPSIHSEAFSVDRSSQGYRPSR